MELFGVDVERCFFGARGASFRRSGVVLLMLGRRRHLGRNGVPRGLVAHHDRLRARAVRAADGVSHVTLGHPVVLRDLRRQRAHRVGHLRWRSRCALVLDRDASHAR